MWVGIWIRRRSSPASTEAYASVDVDADSFSLGPLALVATSESFGSEEPGAPSSGKRVTAG